jgi:hypothetical protein
VNYYERYSLNTFDNNTDRLEHFLYKRYKKKYTLCDTGAWVNKVSTHTNKNDFFHLDNSDLTIVTYLNDNFDGGEFEYIDDNGTTIKIKPKKGLSLIMNNKLPHRVLPVNNGNRLSLVCFFELLKKETKSIL